MQNAKASSEVKRGASPTAATGAAVAFVVVVVVVVVAARTFELTASRNKVSPNNRLFLVAEAEEAAEGGGRLKAMSPHRTWMAI